MRRQVTYIMKVILKLVGYYEVIQECKYMFELVFNIDVPFNFKVLKNIFIRYSNIIGDKELDGCTVTCNSINLKKESIIKFEDNQKVYIFTSNTDIKNKLITIFKLDGKRLPLIQNIDQIDNLIDDNKKIFYNDSKISNNNVEMFNNNSDIFDNNLEMSDSNLEMSDSNLEMSDSNLEMSDSNLEMSDSNLELNKQLNPKLEEYYNEEFIQPNMELFEDPDFISLLRIYQKKPNLYKDLFKYINASQTIMFKENINLDVENNANFIKNLNLGFSDKDIISALKTTSNRINLSVRYLLNNNELISR
jgi:hypothetical protein